MDIRQLRYFVTLADTLHFGQAAQLLNISQPPLSRQISALEEEIGVTLFKRTSRHVELTTAGKHFHTQANRIIQSLNLAIETTQATARGEKGVLSISFTMSAAWSILPSVIHQFSISSPDVEIKLNEVLPRQLNEALLSGNADIGIAFPWLRPTGLEYKKIFTEPLVAAIPTNHHLAIENCINVKALENEPFITFPAATAPALHEMVIGCCRDHGFEPKIYLETHLQQTIVNLVAEGLGVSLVPLSMSKMQLSGLVFRPINQTRYIEQGVIWSSDNTNPCLYRFLDTLNR